MGWVLLYITFSFAQGLQVDLIQTQLTKDQCDVRKAAIIEQLRIPTEELICANWGSPSDIAKQ